MLIAKYVPMFPYTQLRIEAVTDLFPGIAHHVYDDAKFAVV
jgi:hypothetical protein